MQDKREDGAKELAKTHPTAHRRVRHFLFLQGPHGPFFDRLAKRLRATGAHTRRIGFNAGDAFFWSDGASYTAYTGTLADWAGYLEAAGLEGVTDLVLYGDTRPVHATAIALAQARGIVVHCFEEGYLRPYWVTYERGGVNGHSRLMSLEIAQMRDALKDAGQEAPKAPARWGDIRQHVFYGALYHWLVLFWNKAYPHFKGHREGTLWDEFRLHQRRFLLRPFHALLRRFMSWRIRRGGYPYHIVLLQLSHDASIRAHSSYDGMPQFMEECAGAFAAHGPQHHHLVFKAHPLEDGRQKLRRLTGQLAAQYGLTGRLHYVHGGKLAALLDYANSAVTINSTAAQQALWRGIPVRAMGAGVFDKPELTSAQELGAFFNAPQTPDLAAYMAYRRFLLATSQVMGGFYSYKSRARLLRRIVDLMLAPDDPYDALLKRDRRL